MNALDTGDVRYIVAFADKDLTVPIIRTLKFVSRRLDSRGEQVLIFKELRPGGESLDMFVREVDLDAIVSDSNQVLETLTQCFTGDLTTRRFDDE